MTSRTTPVGIIVLALASLTAMGCNAATGAVFQALLDPDETAVSSPEVVTAEPADGGSAVVPWWPHPDGLSLDLPAGWSGMAVQAGQTDELIDAVASTMPTLASRIDEVLVERDVRVSAIAADLDTDGELTPFLVVLAQPTDGRRAREVKAHVREQIYALPGLTDEPFAPHDVILNSAKWVRFDYSISDPDLGELRVRSYLFRYGPEAYLVNFVVGADLADQAEAVFDEIAESLRFGV